MHVEETKGRFGFHLDGGEDELNPAIVQIYVRSSIMSRAADLAISDRLRSAADIDAFIDEAIASLHSVRDQAKQALVSANSP